MTRETLDRELEQLRQEILNLGRMVEEALTAAVEQLKVRDLEGSRQLVARDRLINEKRFAIESDALILIATQQPMASDLRVIAAILEISTELERMGDYAKGIAKINLMIGDQPLLKPLIDIPKMTVVACEMLHQALDAFVRGDVELARSIPARDNEVDHLYNLVYEELIGLIVADQRNTEQANHLLWAAHNLERTADRVINICERVVFTVTGEMEEMNGREQSSVAPHSVS